MATLSYVDILNKAFYDLKQDLRPDEVLDYLLSVGVLTHSEYDRCREHPGRQSQCGELLDILKHKGEDGYKHFCIILDKTNGHLKNILDRIARKEDSPKYVYVSEFDLEEALFEKDKIIREKDKVISEKDRFIAVKEVKTNEKIREIEILEQNNEDDIEKLEGKHQSEVNLLKEDHASSVNRMKMENNKLQTELNQEQERKLAVEERLGVERKQTSNYKKETLQLAKKLVNLEEKFEAYTQIQTLKKGETLRSLPVDSVIPLETGRCVLKTSAECNIKKLFLLPCLHVVCQTCVDQHEHKTIICTCGQEVDLNKETLPVDFVSRNKAMLSAKKFECGYLTESCHRKVVSHCTMCNIPLCQDCQRNHDKTRMNASHEVIAVEQISENPPWKHPGHTTCTDHPGQQLVYVDKHCKKSICNVCYTGAHTGHEVRALETEYEDRKKQQIMDLQKQEAHLEEFRQCLRDRQDRVSSLHQEHEQLEKGLSVIHEKIVVKYLHRVKELLQMIRDESEKVQRKILDDMNYLSDSIAKLETTVDYAKKSLDFTSQVELVELADVITRRMTEDLTRSLPGDKTRDTHIVFCNHGQRALEQLVEIFGDVKSTETPDAEDDNLPLLLETMERCKAAETEVQRLQSSVANTKEETATMTSVLEIPLQQQGFHFMKPDTMYKAFVLQCANLKYDTEKANHNKVHIDNNGMLVNKAGRGPMARVDAGGRFKNFNGTTSTAPFSQSGLPQYVEISTDVDIDKPLKENHVVLSIGVCEQKYRDVGNCIPARQYCYSLDIARWPGQSSVCTYIFKDGYKVNRPFETMPNKVGTHTTLHYGVVYDSHRRVIAFFDVTQMKILTALGNVDCTKPMWPMFGVYADTTARISMKLVVGNDIAMTPEKKTMILEALDQEHMEVL